jgi:hypothetical protein
VRNQKPAGLVEPKVTTPRWRVKGATPAAIN